MLTEAPESDPRLAIGGNEPPEEERLSIRELVASNPGIVLTNEQRRDQLFELIAAEIASHEPNVETAKGRDAIKTLAFSVTKKKTAIDGAGKAMNEAARAQINKVDAARRLVRDKLDGFVEQARAPLTAWEQDQADRADAADALIAQFKADAIVPMGETAAAVRERGVKVWNTAIDREYLGGELADKVEETKTYAVGVLKDALNRLTREEADKAELDRLRAEAAARDEAERIAREAEEAKERKRQCASSVIDHIHECGRGMIGGKPYPYVILIRELEEKVVASEADFGDMAAEVEKVRVATLAQVRQAQSAQAERDAQQAAEREAEAAQQAAERAARAERDRLAQEAEQRRIEEARAERERERLAANKAHRNKVKAAATKAIMVCGVDEETAGKIVMAIIAGDVPRVSVEF